MTEFKLVLPQEPRKFPLGKISLTANALLNLRMQDMSDCLTRHAHGDWGDEPEKVRQGNEFALSHGGLFLSVYHDRNGVKFWIMTDTHRKTTTMLLTEDY